MVLVAVTVEVTPYGLDIHGSDCRFPKPSADN
jgi:hypothetical protein